MRKKLKMRAGGKVRKYAEGGTVRGQRPTEDRARMAADAAAGFDAEEARVMGRRRAANPWLRGESIITNRPVGAAPSRVSTRPDDRMDGPGAGSMQNAEPLPLPPPEPPAAPPMRARARGTVRRSPRNEMSADDLNARELQRLGITPFRKGGAVSVGPKKDDDSEDIVDNSSQRGPIPRSQGLRGAIANTTRRERMDSDYPAQPNKPFRKGGRVVKKK
jgi:hypothetical protein